jgi:UDP-N-acetylmuramyl pentapeptide synthase
VFTIEEIVKATGGELIEGNGKQKLSGVSIDSRTIKKNELFVAVKGRRFNGHDFIRQAESRGAGALLLLDAHNGPAGRLCKKGGSLPVIKVKNTVMALGALARYHRDRFKIPVIAITGSNGKTTTKEILSAILAKRWNVLRNPGTQNNQIGVALTLLSLRKKHRVVVMEAGTDHPGEIARLSWILQPSAGIITNIGPSHLEFFKNLQGVFKAKLELLENLASPV